MKKLLSVLGYCRHYKTATVLSVLFNIFFAVFSAVSLSFIVPFLDLLFKADDLRLVEIILAGEPEFKLSGAYLQTVSNYFLALFIVSYGKAQCMVIICIAVFIVVFLKNLCRYFAMFFVAVIRNGVVRDLRNRIYNKSLRLPLSYYSEEKKGDLMSRMTTDVIEVEWSVMQSLEMIFREPLSIIVLFSAMLIISIKLTLYVLLLLPVAALIVGSLGKSLKGAARKSKTTLAELISVIEETLGSLKVIKGFGAEKAMAGKFSDLNNTYFNQALSVYRRTDLGSPLSEVLVTAVLMLILFLGGNMVFSGALSGAMFITYFAVASQLAPPIKQISIAYNNLQKGVASEERINRILHAQDAIPADHGGKPLKSFEKEIEYRDLSFAYHKGDTGYVLKNINLKIAKGKTIALVGQSGSGKTTLADMLPRFYDADKGNLLLDGTDVREINVEDLRERIGIVTQESVLFNDTVFNNIVFGRKNISREDVIHAAKIANAHEFIMELPNGYDTLIGDRGGKLSGGQRQRLNIARAVLKDPDILILDEATSALDTQSERLVQDALGNLMKNRTSIVIAHRLSTIANADEIIVLGKGEIIERGSHQQLLTLNGTYKQLFDMQSFS